MYINSVIKESELFFHYTVAWFGLVSFCGMALFLWFMAWFHTHTHAVLSSPGLNFGKRGQRDLIFQQ